MMMMDDLRNHDAAPTAEERAWMDTDLVQVMVRSVALAGVALAIGVSASLLIGAEAPQPAVASTAQTAQR